jgi:hypothetical protein
MLAGRACADASLLALQSLNRGWKEILLFHGDMAPFVLDKVEHDVVDGVWEGRAATCVPRPCRRPEQRRRPQMCAKCAHLANAFTPRYPTALEDGDFHFHPLPGWRRPPFMLDGPITANGSSPMSKKHFPGVIVLIDNLASHKSLRIATAIEMVAERSVEALVTSCAFKRRVQQISDQCCNQTSSAHHDK